MSDLKTFLEMIERDNFLVLDTETTGLRQGEICQIAIIESTGAVLLDCLVKTQDPIPADATAIHGITDAMVADSPTWDLLVKPVQDMLQGRDLVVYNAIYDRKMMHQTAERAGLPKVEWKEVATWWCAMEAAAEWYGDWNSYHQSYRYQKLVRIAYLLGIPTNGAHTALADAQMTLAVCRAMLRQQEAAS